MRGATEFNEPGVLMTFEETTDDIVRNARSLGFEYRRTGGKKKLFLDYVRIERNEIQETGEYDLEGIFVRLNYAIDTLGAKRVVLVRSKACSRGSVTVLILRAELRRFR